MVRVLNDRPSRLQRRFANLGLKASRDYDDFWASFDQVFEAYMALLIHHGKPVIDGALNEL